MDLLASNMESITSFSDRISSTLQGTRQQISKLSGVHTLLKRLQFLFKLPTTLKAHLEEKNYPQVNSSNILFHLLTNHSLRQCKITCTRKKCCNNTETCCHSKAFKRTAKAF